MMKHFAITSESINKKDELIADEMIQRGFKDELPDLFL
jgi:hypothetical protein